jgi:hypothetical protein
VQKIESSTSLVSDLVLKLDLAYPHSERLKQTEKQLADEAATLHGIIQSMSTNYEKASDQVDEKQQLLDSLTEENNDLKFKLAEKLDQEEHAAQALISVYFITAFTTPHDNNLPYFYLTSSINSTIASSRSLISSRKSFIRPNIRFIFSFLFSVSPNSSIFDDTTRTFLLYTLNRPFSSSTVH